MSKFSDQLRALSIINNSDLLKRFGAVGDVAIEYQRPADGRLGWTDTYHTLIWSPYPHPKLESDGIRLPHKRFLGKRRDSFQTAINWAMGEFGHDYVPSPHGGYIPDHVRQKARNAVRSNDDRTDHATARVHPEPKA